MHHLCQDEQVLETVSDLFGEEGYEIRGQLVDSWISPDGGQCCVPPLGIRFVEEGRRELSKKLLRLLGEHMLDERLEGNVVQAIGSSEMWIGVGSFRE